MRRYLLSLIALAWLALPAHATLDRDCNYTQGSTPIAQGFANCDEELVEIYKRAIITQSSVAGINTIEVTSTAPNLTAYTDGLAIIFTPASSITGAATLNIDNIGAVTLANEAGSNLGSGDLVAGTTYIGLYKSSENKFRVINRNTAGAAGAPTTADYVTISANGTLSAERVITAGNHIGLTDGGANSTITIAVNDAELTSIAGLTSAADGLPYYTGSGTAALATFTAFGRSLVDDANAAAGWTTIEGDERSQDAIGTILTDGTFIDFTYTDGGPTIAATIIAGSLTATELGADSVGSSELDIGDTEAEIEGAIDTLASLTSIQSLTVTLADAGADAVLGWDDSAGAYENLTDGEVATIVAGQEATLEAVLDLADLQGDLALGTKTSGNYVDDVLSGTGISVSHSAGEGSDATIAFNYADAGADPALSADECRFTNDTTSAGVMVCEGDTANASETRIDITEPTADRVMTIPNADSNPVRPLACSGTDKVSAIAADGTVSCSADEGGAGSGDNIRVEDADDAGTYTAAADADFGDSGDINFALNETPSPDEITATVRADAVALTTDTTGNYVGSVADGTGVDGTAAAEGATYTPSLDLTEINSATWGNTGGFTAFTFDAGAVDPVITMGSGTVTWSAVTAYNLDDEAELRLFEEDGGGANYKGFKSPAAVTASTTCTFEDDANFIPDTCVGDGSDADTNTLGPDGDKGDITVGGTGTTLAIDANVVQAAEIDETDSFDWTGIHTFDSDAVQIDDTNASHQLVITPGSDLSADRVLTITTGDAARTLTLSDNATLNDADYGDITTSSDFTVFNIDADTISTGEIAANGVAISEMADDAVGIDELDLITGDTPVDGDCLTYDAGAGGTIEAITCPGAAAGDSVTINGAGVVDPDFDDATPAATGSNVNVTWQVSGSDVSAQIQAATDAVRGVIEEATTGEAEAGTDTDRAVTPAGLLAAVTGKKAIWLPGGSLTPRTTAGCEIADLELATNDIMLRTCNYDTTTEEGAGFTIKMPATWDEGTVTFVPVWTHPATVTNFGVVWSVSCLATSNDDAMDAALGTPQTSTDTGGTTSDQYTGPESAAITCAGTPAANDTIYFEIERTPGAGSDTLGVDAYLLGVTVYYTDNAFVEP